MYTFIKFLHLVAAILWLGGMGFMLLFLRPSLGTLDQASDRLRLLASVMQRFFVVVWGAIGVLLVSGGVMFSMAGARAAPLGWHFMAGVGLLMFLVFGHLYFAPYQRMRRHITASAWPAAAAQAAQIARAVWINFVLGWLAVAAVILLA
jgi:uncharacterized membrane protein